MYQWGETTRVVVYALAALLVAAAAYFLGSLNFAIIISSKKYNQDIRNYGSNNAGMTNMMRTYGRKAAAFTLIGDALKAVVSCVIGYVFLGQIGAYIAGLFCILGHVFPIYYKFKGGKGVVTAGITILMCNPIVFVIVLAIFLILVVCTRYISFGSVISMLLYPVILDRVDKLLPIWGVYDGTEGSIGGIFAILMAVIIVFKHIPNIKRLLNGTESKFSFKKSVKSPKEETTESKEENKEDKT
ncbi:MAG: glycerol-3-phosphate 1-O-acyltransferase PlsY [Clostridia bacterium]|nr:glycerol-3-phosphate 1-O-acyltransferase PlsY [Clostridia bacterium]